MFAIVLPRLLFMLWTPLSVQPPTPGLRSTTPPGALPTSGQSERTLAAGDIHPYRVPVKAGQFFAVRVAQQGIDVVISLSDADGTTRREVNFSDGPRGLETISWIADGPGEMRLDVRSRRAGGAAGRYILAMDGP